MRSPVGPILTVAPTSHCETLCDKACVGEGSLAKGIPSPLSPDGHNYVLSGGPSKEPVRFAKITRSENDSSKTRVGAPVLPMCRQECWRTRCITELPKSFYYSVGTLCLHIGTLKK